MGANSGTVSERLRQKAEIRTKSVMIDGDEFIVREIGAADFSAYGRLLSKDQRLATAQLLRQCVMNGDGQTALTEEDALAVTASMRVTMPLVQAIMQVSGMGDDEKESDAS